MGTPGSTSRASERALIGNPSLHSGPLERCGLRCSAADSGDFITHLTIVSEAKVLGSSPHTRNHLTQSPIYANVSNSPHGIRCDLRASRACLARKAAGWGLGYATEIVEHDLLQRFGIQLATCDRAQDDRGKAIANALQRIRIGSWLPLERNRDALIEHAIHHRERVRRVMRVPKGHDIAPWAKGTRICRALH
jgi:hypothetical protein